MMHKKKLATRDAKSTGIGTKKKKTLLKMMVVKK